MNDFIDHQTKKALTLGSWNACHWSSSEDAQFLKICDYAYEKGLRSFDTAESYGNGHAEMLLGRALKGKRDACTISSKFQHTHSRSGSIRKALEKTLRRLHTDYIDTYYQHWPASHIELDETLETLVKLKEENLIQKIGVSNWTLQEFSECSLSDYIDVLQTPYNLLWRYGENDLIPYCRKKSIQLSLYAPFCQGLLLRDLRTSVTKDPRNKNIFYDKHKEERLTLSRQLRDLSSELSIAPATLCLKWIWSQLGDGNIVAGCSSIHHLDDIISHSHQSIPQKAYDTLETASRPFIMTADYTSLWRWHSRAAK